LFQTRCIISRSPRVRGTGDLHLDGPAGHGRRQVVQGSLDKTGHVDIGRSHLAPRSPRKGQDIVDQPRHLHHAIAYDLDQA
jgi:hypothetical protein